MKEAAPVEGDMVAGAVPGEKAGVAPRKTRHKRFRTDQWPAHWQMVPYQRDPPKPPDVCVGCWWIFQDYPGHRPHALSSTGLCLFGGRPDDAESSKPKGRSGPQPRAGAAPATPKGPQGEVQASPLSPATDSRLGEGSGAAPSTLRAAASGVSRR